MEMDKVKNWLIENKLTLNFSKSCYRYLLINKNPKQIVSSAFNISIDGNKIERCSSTQYLGLYLDEKLSWSTHIRYRKLLRPINFQMRITPQVMNIIQILFDRSNVCI